MIAIRCRQCDYELAELDNTRLVISPRWRPQTEGPEDGNRLVLPPNEVKRIKGTVRALRGGTRVGPNEVARMRPRGPGPGRKSLPLPAYRTDPLLLWNRIVLEGGTLRLQCICKTWNLIDKARLTEN